MFVSEETTTLTSHKLSAHLVDLFKKDERVRYHYKEKSKEDKQVEMEIYNS
jgi:hypothetical protein